MYRKYLIIIFAGLFALSAQAQSGLKELGRPVKTEIPGYDRAFCTKIDVDQRLCQGYLNDESESSDFFISDRSKQLSKWTAGDAFLGDLSQFSAATADLDGDGRSELVVAKLSAQSNGMGIKYWDVYILSSDRSRNPLRFSAEDFSLAGSFFRRKASKQWDILVASWEWSGSSKPSLGLVGRWYNYKGGTLIPNQKKTISVRRYTKNFEKQRNATLSNVRVPSLWLTPRTSRQFRHDEEIYTRPNLTPWRIDSVDEVTDKGIFKLKIAVSEPPIKRMIFDSVKDASDDNEIFKRVGTRASRRVFPKNYAPADPSLWVGKNAMYGTYNVGTAGEGAILWIEF